MNRACLLLAVAGCLAAGSVSAQLVYRCGSEYTRVPCAEGRPIDVSDPVTPERRAEAREAARREQRLGEAMARERRAEAAAYRPTLAANIGPAKPAVTAPTPASKKKAKTKKRLGEPVDGTFVARVPKAKASAG